MRMEKFPLALVTGAANRLGRAFSLALARRGFALLLHYNRSVDQATALLNEIHALNVPVYKVRADLTDSSQIESLFTYLDSLGFCLQILVNSAAMMPRGDLAVISVREWDTTLDINLRAPFLLSQRAAERMHEGGLIVNMTDSSIKKTWTNYPAYLVSKSGLEALTRHLAKTYAPRIRVNAVAPGLVLPSAEISEEMWTKLVERSPLKRPVTVDEITSALEFLIDNESVTGQTIVVDGGYSLL
jgi:pteridine reductase